MAFEFADIFFGSHQKREGIPTPADGAVRIYKKVGKSFTTSGFFKKSSDIFFGATSQNKNSTLLGAVFVFSLICPKFLTSICLFPARSKVSDPL